MSTSRANAFPAPSGVQRSVAAHPSSNSVADTMEASAIMKEAEARHASFRRNSMATAVEAEEQRQDMDLQMRAMNNIARRDSIGYNGMYGHHMGIGGSPYSMMGADPLTMASLGSMYPGSCGMNPMLGAYDPLAMQATYAANPMLAAQMANIRAVSHLGTPYGGLGMGMPFAGGLGMGMGMGGLGMGMGMGMGVNPLLSQRSLALGGGLGLGGLGMMNPMAGDIMTSRLVAGVF